MQRQRIVSVVAGGWSFSEVPHELVPGHVIAVNDAALHLQCAVSEVVSMDRLWTENRWRDILYFNVPTHLRRSAVQNIPAEHIPPHVHVFECDHESVQMHDDYFSLGPFSLRPERIDGTNSGMCGVSRAYQVAADGARVLLFGFDMQDGPQGQRHWYPPYPWGGGTGRGKFDDWASQFRRVARQFAKRDIMVYSVSSRTKIRDFPVVSHLELEKMGMAA